MLYNGKLGAGFNAQAERKLPIKKASFIDFKASGGVYTNGARANLYAGIGHEHNTERGYNPITLNGGLEANYVRDNETVSLTTDFEQTKTQSTTLGYQNRDLQFNFKSGVEYAAKNGKFTLGVGYKGGVNIPLDEGYSITHQHFLSTTNVTPEGIVNKEANLSVTLEEKPETNMNISFYGNANYKLNERLSLNLNGEYGNNNREISFGASYKFY